MHCNYIEYYDQRLYNSGVDVVVPNERENSETIKLVGRKKNIEAAKERIEKMIETNMKLNANDGESTSNNSGRGGANNNGSNNTFDTVVKMSIPVDKYRQLAQRQSPALKKIYVSVESIRLREEFIWLLVIRVMKLTVESYRLKQADLSILSSLMLMM